MSKSEPNDYESESQPPEAPEFTASGARMRAPVGVARGHRPSAFGVPRTSSTFPDTLPPSRSPGGNRVDRANAAPEPRFVESSIPPAPEPLAVTDPEPLLGVPAVPLVTSSLPAIPAAARSDAIAMRPPASSVRPWLGMGAFAIMACAVTFTLLRARSAQAPHAPEVANTPAVAAQVGARVPPEPVAEAAAAPELAEPAEPVAPPAVEPSPAEIEARSREGWIRAFEAMLPSDPKQAAESLRGRGEEALAAGDPVLADQLLEKALKFDGANPHTAIAMARLRIAQDQLDAAETWTLRAIELRPRRPEYREFHASLLQRLGRLDDAQKARKRARALAR